MGHFLGRWVRHTHPDWDLPTYQWGSLFWVRELDVGIKTGCTSWVQTSFEVSGQTGRDWEAGKTGRDGQHPPGRRMLYVWSGKVHVASSLPEHMGRGDHNSCSPGSLTGWSEG